MIIYLHGFASSSYSKKAQKFKTHFGTKEEFIAQNLPFIPKLATYNIDELINLCAGIEEVKLIGSSLGGYYASYFANKYNLKAVLINPAVYPDKTFRKYSHLESKSYFDGSRFEFTQTHIDDLNLYRVDNYRDVSKFLVCLTKGDEVLDYRDAVEKFQGAKFIIDENGDHSFSDIEKHFDAIDEFLR